MRNFSTKPNYVLEDLLKSDYKFRVMSFIKKYFFNAEVLDFDFSNLPNEIIEYLEVRQSKSTGFDLNVSKSDFIQTYQVLFDDNSRIYFTYQIYNYFNNDDIFMYFLDCSSNNDFKGYGVIRYSLDSENDSTYNPKFSCRFTEEPIVEYAFTKSEFRREGLTQRRLILMNCFTKAFFDKSLYSGSVTLDYSRSLWEKLVEKNLAEEAEDLFGSLYRFK